MRDFWLGVATTPALIGTGWLLHRIIRWINKHGDLFVSLRLPLHSPQKRARFAAFAASCRRAYLMTFAGFGVVFIAGYRGGQFGQIHKAVCDVLADPMCHD